MIKHNYIFVKTFKLINIWERLMFITTPTPPASESHYLYYKSKHPQILVGFFVEWHINLCELFNAKAILVEWQ